MGVCKKCGGCCLVLVPVVAVLLRVGAGRAWTALVMDCSQPAVPLVPEEDAAKYEAMNVVYSSDRKNFPGLLTGMISLARNLAEPEKCKIHVVAPEQDLPGLEDLLECFRREVSAPPSVRAVPEVQLHAMRKTPFDLDKLSGGLFPFLALNDALWARLYIPEYLPGERRALYLDTDTVVVSDVAPYYRKRMQHVYAASREARKIAGDEPELLRKWHRTADAAENVTADTFFNSGVLLIDLERWRREGVADRLKRWYERMHADAINSSLAVTDQLLLNLAFQGGDIDLMDWRWNVLGMGVPIPVPRHCVEEARIFHFHGCLGFEVHNRKYWHKERPGHCKWNEWVLEPYLPKQACSALP